jgi:hypothetical protein
MGAKYIDAFGDSPIVDTDFVFKYKRERVLVKYEENNKIER